MSSATVEPVTGMSFLEIVDLGIMNEEAIEALQARGDMCVVTGCTRKPLADKSDQIRYDIVPAAEIAAYIRQCESKIGSEVFHMSAYPARDMWEAKLKVKRLDGSTVGGYRHGFQSKRLWNPPKSR